MNPSATKCEVERVIEGMGYRFSLRLGICADSIIGGFSEPDHLNLTTVVAVVLLFTHEPSLKQIQLCIEL